MFKGSWVPGIAVVCCLAVAPAMAGQGRCQRGGGCSNGGPDAKAACGSTCKATSSALASCRVDGKGGDCGRSACDGQCGQGQGEQRRMRYRNAESGGPECRRSNCQGDATGFGRQMRMGRGYGWGRGNSNAGQGADRPCRANGSL